MSGFEVVTFPLVPCVMCVVRLCRFLIFALFLTFITYADILLSKQKTCIQALDLGNSFSVYSVHVTE